MRIGFNSNISDCFLVVFVDEERYLGNNCDQITQETVLSTNICVFYFGFD